MDEFIVKYSMWIFIENLRASEQARKRTHKRKINYTWKMMRKKNRICRNFLSGCRIAVWAFAHTTQKLVVQEQQRKKNNNGWNSLYIFQPVWNGEKDRKE